MCDHFAYTYVSRDFVVLDITYPHGSIKMCAPLQASKLSADGARIAQTLSRDIAALVRVYLYASDRDIYFAEFTFTPDGCRRELYLATGRAASNTRQFLDCCRRNPCTCSATARACRCCAAALLAPAAPPPVLAERPPPPRSPCNSSDAACARR